MTQVQLEEQQTREAEAHRRIAEVWANKKFMFGVYASMDALRRGERPTPSKDLKRKYGRS